MKNTVKTFQQQKDEHKKITMLTAYDYSTAKIMDKSWYKWHIDWRFTRYGNAWL